MNYYLFILNDLTIGEKKINYGEIIDDLEQNNMWIFSESSPHIKKLKESDKVIIYVSGLGRRFFYGTFTIMSNINQIDDSMSNKVFYKYFKYFCKISKVKKIKKRIFMKDIKDNLEFIKDKKNYGLHLRQSVTKISENDFNLILKNMN